METFDEHGVATKKRKIETCGQSQQNTNETGFEEKLSGMLCKYKYILIK